MLHSNLKKKKIPIIRLFFIEFNNILNYLEDNRKEKEKIGSHDF